MISRLRNRHISNSPALLHAFSSSFQTGEFDDAMEDLDMAIELNPNYAVAYYQKGIVQKQMTLKM
jgi:tetratricopeptide (TPR) repeat protein